MPRALLLNADWTPLHFVNDWRAVRLLMPDVHGKIRAEVVYDFQTGEPAVWNEGFTSPGATPDAPLKSIPIPATLRLKKFVRKKWKAPRFRKRVLFNRDGWKCQYCGEKVGLHNVEVEHVMPQSRRGPTSWLNCVTSCHTCNKRKANRTPEEAGMPLLKAPVIPTPLHFWDALKTDCWHPSWDIYVPRS